MGDMADLLYEDMMDQQIEDFYYNFDRPLLKDSTTKETGMEQNCVFAALQDLVENHADDTIIY